MSKSSLITKNQDFRDISKERIILLEQELSDTKANLQSMVEEIETSNEELQATNEELLASNEELQSTNEELQSVNEELHTVNSEYQEKMEEIAAINSDLENLIDSTEIGTIFLDKNLNIRNGVGILPNGQLIFGMSKQKINFYDFASFFKSLGCKNALYLDGYISKTYLPSKNWISQDGKFGIIIGETISKKRN